MHEDRNQNQDKYSRYISASEVKDTSESWSIRIQTMCWLSWQSATDTLAVGGKDRLVILVVTYSGHCADFDKFQRNVCFMKQRVCFH